MKCEFEYCVYNLNYSCIVDEPGINSLGMCDACIVVSFEREVLEEEKKRQRIELEKRWDEGI